MNPMDILYNILPFFFIANVFILFYFIDLNKKLFLKQFKKIDRLTLLIIIVVIVFSFVLRLLIPVYHNMWLDELYYVDAAKNLLNDFQNVHDRLIGWPMILSLVFLITGVNNVIAVYAGIFFGIAAIPVFFMLSFTATNRKCISLLATLIFSLMPSLIRWSSSAETNISALFFILLAIWFSFLYYKNPTKRLLWMCLLSISLSFHFRPENIFVAPIFLLGAYFYVPDIKKKLLKGKEVIITFLVMVIPTTILIFYFYLTKATADIDALKSESSVFILFMYPANYFENLMDFSSLLFFFLLSVLSLFGLYYIFKKERKLFYFLLGWVLIYYLFISAVSPGQLSIGALERFNMLLFPQISLICASGIFYILNKIKFRKLKFFSFKGIMFLVFLTLISMFIGFSYIDSYKKVSGPREHHMLQTKIPSFAEDVFSRDCTIITTYPLLFTSTEFDKISMLDIYDDREEYLNRFSKGDCLLFYEGYYCKTLDHKFHNSEHSSFELCKILKDELDLTLNKTYSKGRFSYSFHNVNFN